jgi:hypothetical protein
MEAACICLHIAALVNGHLNGSSMEGQQLISRCVTVGQRCSEVGQRCNLGTERRLCCLQPVAVAPYMTTGGTDSSHYMNITTNGALRFKPMEINRTAGDTLRPHGINERLAVANFLKGVCAFLHILRRFGDV